MMTSLMVIFVLLLVVYLKKEQERSAIQQKTQKQVTETITDLNSYLVSLTEELAKNNPELPAIQVKPVGKRMLMIIVPEVPGGELFKTKEDEPSAALRLIMTRLADGMLDRIVGKADVRALIQSVTIEGHTDRDQFRDAAGKIIPFKNLELSQGRARKVLQIFLERASTGRPGSLREDPELVRGVQKLFAAAGRAEWDCPHDALSRECRNVVIKIRGISSDEASDDPPSGLSTEVSP